MAKNALFQLGHWVRSNICVSSHILNVEGDTESGERSRWDTVEAMEETPLQGTAERAQNEFRRSLQSVFKDNYRVDEIMGCIEEWELEM